MAETWVLSPNYSNTSYNFTGLSFNSNGETFSSIKVVGGFSNDELYYDNKDIAYIQDDDYVNWMEGEAYKTVTFSTPPTGDLLTWLRANGMKQSNKLSVDLTTLSGWANLAPGNHTIKIVAKGTGYRDSEKSAGVEVTKAAEVYTDCLTFTGESSEFTLKASNKTWDGTLEWSTDHSTWTTLTGTEAMQSVGKKLYLRGKGNTTFADIHFGVQWQLSAKASCSGNIQTLLDYENPPTSIIGEYGYSQMFRYCTNLTAAPELPATTLAKSCYANMFAGCVNLTVAPFLPATTLAKSCYAAMFAGCVNLTVAPFLPANNLTENCYNSIFKSCSKLKVNTSSGNKIFTCPSSIPTNAVVDMFYATGGTFTGTPTAGNTYYYTE